MNQHPVAVNITDLEVADLGGPEPRTIGNAEGCAIFEPGPGRCRQDVGHLLDTEHHGQLARFGAELHVALQTLMSIRCSSLHLCPQ